MPTVSASQENLVTPGNMIFIPRRMSSLIRDNKEVYLCLIVSLWRWSSSRDLWRGPGSSRLFAGAQDEFPQGRRASGRSRRGPDPKGSPSGGTGTEEDRPRPLRHLRPEQSAAHYRGAGQPDCPS
jgi:hypothetical protein